MELREFSREIIDKARLLDPKAVAALFEHYYPKIYRYFYYRVESNEQAEDLASEVFVKLVKSIKRQSGNFEPWLYTIAKNTLTDHYRRAAIRKETNLDEEILETMSDTKTQDNAPLTQEELKAVIGKLTDEQQQVITLRFIEGYDTAKTAEILKKNVGAIKALQFRALVSLKEILKEGQIS